MYTCSMAYDYDKLYGETRDALGQPTAIFVDFFDRLKGQNCRVLDVGCGQGRDALFIARAGHHVTGVDLSANGIRDLTAAAAAENLDVQGIVADLTGFQPHGTYDVILIDRTLHMLDPEPRHRVMDRLLDHVDDNGWMLIADENANIPDLSRVIAAHRTRWRTEVKTPGYLFLQRTA